MADFWRRLGVLCTLLLLGWHRASWALPAEQYTVTDLGPVLSVTALAKDADTVLSTQLLTGLQRAVVLGAIERTLNLLPDGVSAIPLGIDHGRVVGFASTGFMGLFMHAFLFTLDDGIRDLGTLGSADLISVATDINGAGTIVGFGQTPEHPGFVPLLFPGGGPPVPLPTLGGLSGGAQALNDVGEAVGNAATPIRNIHATLWPPEGGVLDLQTAPFDSSQALDINESQTVVGFGTIAEAQVGFRWRATTGMVPLLPLAGDNAARAQSINDAGDVVGQSVLQDPALPRTQHLAAVFWGEDHQPIDLQTRLVDASEVVLESAVGINTAGRIAALGRIGEAAHAFLLTPVVPPAPPVVEEPPVVEAPTPRLTRAERIARLEAWITRLLTRLDVGGRGWTDIIVDRRINGIDHELIETRNLQLVRKLRR